MQFPIAKKILTAMGIKYLEYEGYEADDIIGTISSWCDKDPEYEALIVSSDKDLLQLISDETVVKLLKPKDYIMMNKATFIQTYGFEPIKMIDLKALMGDASDNIPGVKGIGEKTAIQLLEKYTTIDNLYAHIDEIKGKTKEKLEKNSIYTIGRYGAWIYNSMEDSMVAAKSLLKKNHRRTQQKLCLKKQKRITQICRFPRNPPMQKVIHAVNHKSA